MGSGEKKGEIPAYLQDWDEAIKKLAKGFTLLTDAT